MTDINAIIAEVLAIAHRRVSPVGTEPYRDELLVGEILRLRAALTETLDAIVSPAAEAMTVMAHIHGMPYNGPVIDVKAMRALLEGEDKP